MTNTAMGLGDGPRIDLSIVGYQYPALQGDGTGKDWDANWLVIAGDAVAEDGRGWSFRDPCLTTSEARKLGDWLRGAVDGSVPPAAFRNGAVEQLLVFTEPNVAFSLADRVEDDVVIRAHLSLEFRPPWLSGSGDPALFDYFLLLCMPVTRLALAVENWERMIVAHPPR